MTDLASCLLNSSNSLLAYIDPGSGSAFISAIVGVFVAAGLAIKTYWYKIKGLFSSKKDASETESSEEKKA